MPMQSDDEFCGEPSFCVSPVGSDGEFVGDGDCLPATPTGKGRGRRARPADLCIYLMLSSTTSGLRPGLAPPGEFADDGLSGIIWFQWELVDDAGMFELDGAATEMAKRARAQGRGEFFGFPVYTVVDYAFLQKDDFLPQPDGQAHEMLRQIVSGGLGNRAGDDVDVGSVGDVASRWQRENGRALNLTRVKAHLVWLREFTPTRRPCIASV